MGTHVFETSSFRNAPGRMAPLSHFRPFRDFLPLVSRPGLLPNGGNAMRITLACLAALLTCAPASAQPAKPLSHREVLELLPSDTLGVMFYPCDGVAAAKLGALGFRSARLEFFF